MRGVQSQRSRLRAAVHQPLALLARRSWRRHTWLLSGIPRSGSSLCCRLIGELPDVVALTEPIQDVQTQAVSPEDACRRIENFARSVRVRILEEGWAPTVHVDGQLVDNLVANPRAPGLRRWSAERGDIAIDAPTSRRFTLVIKHNALFAALLPRLGRTFPCLGLVRNPLAVLASWRTVDMKVRDGRLPAGERFDPRLAAGLSAEKQTLKRQILVLNWFFEQYQGYLPPERVVRYEDVVQSRGAVLHRAIGARTSTAKPLASRNANALYDRDVDDLLAGLEEDRGAWTRFYSPEDCRQAAESIRAVP